MTVLVSELIDTDAALERLRPEWHALWRRTTGATPFQSPDWLLAWWHQFGTGSPNVAVLRADGRLAGVLPLYVLDGRLLPIGAGVTDIQDALLDPVLPPSSVGALLEAALSDLRCELTDLPPGSPLRSAEPPPGWRAKLHEIDSCPVLCLSDGIPRARLRKLRMARHRTARIGGFTTEIATASTVMELLEQLIALHQARWQEIGEAGVFADTRLAAFHREAAPALLAYGALRLQVLRFADRVVAAVYALLALGRLMLYLHGFDHRYAFESPGSLLLGEMVEQAAAEGRNEIHFLRGDEAYKYAWGAVVRRNATRTLLPP